MSELLGKGHPSHGARPAMQDALPSRLGIVAHEMEGDATGVGRYLEGLLSGLAQTTAPLTYVLFFKGRAFEHPLWTRATAAQATSEDRSSGGPRFEAVFDDRPQWHPVLWEQLRLPWLLRRRRLKALFSPAYSLPAAIDVPSLVTLHDLSFEHLPSEFGFKERWRRRLLARRAASKATRVLADSRVIARDIETTYDVSPGKIGVVPLAVGRRFTAPPRELVPEGSDGGRQDAADARARRQLGIEGPYLLFLGSLLPRRRVDLVIAAFQHLAARYPDLQLVLSGHNALPRPQDLDDWIAESGVAARIQHLGYVPEEALLPLYRGARLTYYLSTYEGFGLPPMESLALGVPAVVSHGLALDDLWPDYPLRLERWTVDDLARISERGLSLGAARHVLAQEGQERMARFTWRHGAETFLEQVAIAMTEGAPR